MPMIPVDQGVSVHCAVDDFLWPWEQPTAVLMMHGFARNANFWNRWVPPVADSRRVYRPDLLGCGSSDAPAPGYAYTPEKIGAQILAVLDALSPFGITHLDMPLTPPRIWTAVQRASNGASQ